MNSLTVILQTVSTIAGAAIGAAVSYFVSRHQFRAAVLSKNRQDWINTMRDTLSEYNSLIHDIASDFTTRGKVRSAVEGMRDYARANVLLNRTKLLVNPMEEDHKALLKTMYDMRTLATKANDSDIFKRLGDLDEKFTSVAQDILKKEWKRVKAGK